MAAVEHESQIRGHLIDYVFGAPPESLSFPARVARSYAWLAGSFFCGLAAFICNLILVPLSVILFPLCLWGFGFWIVLCAVNRSLAIFEDLSNQWAVVGAQGFQMPKFADDFEKARWQLLFSTPTFKLIGYYMGLRAPLALADGVMLVLCTALFVPGIFVAPWYVKLRVNQLGLVVPKKPTQPQLELPEA